MKKSKYVFLVIFTFIIVAKSIFCQSEPVNYFYDYFPISVYNPSLNNSANGHIKFDFSEIWTSNNLLDIAVISNVNYNNQFYRYGHYNINQSLAQPYQFSSPPDMYYAENRPDDIFKMKDVLFVKLRDGNYPKDLIIIKGDDQIGTLQIHLNTNNQIYPVSSYIPYAGGNNIDAGIFDYWDIREDVAVSSNNQIRIFKNNGDGTLDVNPWIFQYSAEKVKLKQINDKCRYNIQNSSSDRADLIFYNKSYNPDRTRITILKNNNSNGFEQIHSLIFMWIF